MTITAAIWGFGEFKMEHFSIACGCAYCPGGTKISTYGVIFYISERHGSHL